MGQSVIKIIRCSEKHKGARVMSFFFRSVQIFGRQKKDRKFVAIFSKSQSVTYLSMFLLENSEINACEHIKV